MGYCKSCGSQNILWVQRPDGQGWMPPLEIDGSTYSIEIEFDEDGIARQKSVMARPHNCPNYAQYRAARDAQAQAAAAEWLGGIQSPDAPAPTPPTPVQPGYVKPPVRKDAPVITADRQRQQEYYADYRVAYANVCRYCDAGIGEACRTRGGRAMDEPDGAGTVGVHAIRRDDYCYPEFKREVRRPAGSAPVPVAAPEPATPPKVKPKPSMTPNQLRSLAGNTLAGDWRYALEVWCPLCGVLKGELCTKVTDGHDLAGRTHKVRQAEWIDRQIDARLREFPEITLTTPCTYCGALNGEACYSRLSGNSTTTGPHKARKDAWLAR